MNNYNDYHDYLAHYGVKGMKWGVRKRGTSVEVYSRNRTGDYYTRDEKDHMTKVATKNLTKNYKKATKNRDLYERSSSKTKDAYKQAKYIAKAKEFAKQSDLYSKRLKDIDSGKIKAGKDFVTNSYFGTNVLLDVIGLPNIHWGDTVDFKN